MQKKLTPRQIRNLMVASLSSLVLALPLFSQPLGLSTAWNDDLAGSNSESSVIEATTATSKTASVQVLEPVETADLGTPVYNRGQFGELGTGTKAPAEVTGESDKPDGLDKPDSKADPDGNEVPDHGYDEILPQDFVLILKPQVSGEGYEPDSEIFKVTPVEYTLYISASNLNLRVLPTTTSDVIVQLKFGDKVKAIGENDDWMLVTFDGKTGYLMTKYTSTSMVFESVKETVYVDAGILNLRKSPSKDADIVTKLERNDKLTRIGIAGDWSKVKTASGKTGYVVSEHLTKKAPPAPASSKKSSSSGSSSGSSINPGSSSVSGTAARAVELAYQALGVRYRYGSENMGGMDCSGLIYWIYTKNLGISVPRSSGSYGGAGYSVSRDDIRPGDVIAMDTRVGDGHKSITHLGIYVGGGNMIHASSRLGRVVIRNVNDYVSNGIQIITIRRFINN